MDKFGHLSLDAGLGLCWSTLAASCILIKLFPRELNFISRHGKMKPVNTTNIGRTSRSSFDSFLEFVAEFNVPKCYFMHMYFVGLVVIVALAYSYGGQEQTSAWKDWKVTERGYNMVPLCLFFVHVMRRFLECCFITDFGSSVMHISGYIVGMLHYILAPVTLLSVENIKDTTIDTQPINNSLGTFRTGVVAMFLVCNACQFYFHYYFFRMKIRARQRRQKNKYSFPCGFGFDSVCCPHYSSECCLYICLWMLQRNRISTACMGLWVIVNLMTVSDEHWKWYHETFPEQSSRNRSKGWKRIWPGVY